MTEKVQNPVERPRAGRYAFVASIELVDLQTEARSQVEVTVLSLYGCAVNSKPFPSGTKLRVRIVSKGEAFAAFGRVAYTNVGGEIGIVFTRMEPSDQLILEKWISELRDEIAQTSPKVP